MYLMWCEINHIIIIIINKLPAVLSRDLAGFSLFGEAEIWSHDSLPNLICKNLG